MFLGLGFNAAAVARPPMSAAQQVQQMAQSGQVMGTDSARDKLVKDTRRDAVAKLMGGKAGQKKIEKKAASVAGKKKA